MDVRDHRAYHQVRDEMQARFIASATGMPPTDEQRESVDQFQQLAIEFATAITQLAPEGRDQALALIHLEDALMRANRAIFSGGAK